MVYADFEYYKSVYLGDSLTEEEFPRYALRASQYLDYYTRGKAEKSAELECVKMACCALAEQYKLITQAMDVAANSMSAAASGTSGELQSQTVGGWSKSYRSGGESALSAQNARASLQKGLSEIAMQYLASSGLLYRGGGCCCGDVPAHGDCLQCR